MRVATIPTQGGVEDVVMRLLGKGETMPLEVMGLSERNYREMLNILSKPYGMILVVGPPVPVRRRPCMPPFVISTHRTG